DARRPVRRRHAQDDLRRLAPEEAAIAAEDQRLALRAPGRVEDRLDEVFEKAVLAEGARLLAQARGAGLLALDRAGLDGRHALPSRRSGDNGATIAEVAGQRAAACRWRQAMGKPRPSATRDPTISPSSEVASTAAASPAMRPAAA